MKRILFFVLLMVCIRSVVYAVEPNNTFAPTPTPMVYVVSEEVQNAADEYEVSVNYAVETFGFDESVEYPYMPTHLDPVCYRGYLSLTSGFKDGDCYAAYGGWNEAEVQDYLNFLMYLGYECAEYSCEIPGTLEWQLSNPTPREDGKGLLDNVKVFYAAEKEMLVIAYPYVDAFLYESWSESTLSYPYWRYLLNEPTPYTFENISGHTITVEEIIYARDMSVCSQEKPVFRLHTEDPNDPYKMILVPRGEPYHDMWLMDAPEEEDLLLMMVRLTFDQPVDKQFVDRLHIAVADSDFESAHQAEFPMMYGWDDLCVLSPWTEDTVSSNLWAVFPFRYYDLEATKRVYLYLQEDDQTWIGDLREWTYADVYQENVGIRMY